MSGIGGGSMSMGMPSAYPDPSDYGSSSSMAFGEGSGFGASNIGGSSGGTSSSVSAPVTDTRVTKQVRQCITMIGQRSTRVNKRWRDLSFDFLFFV